MNHVSDVTKTAKRILEDWKISDFEALQIAVQIQRNQFYESANVINGFKDAPSALEKIAMEIEALSNVIAEGVDVTNHTVS